VLSGLFWMSTIWAYARFARTSISSGSIRHSSFVIRHSSYLLSLLLFALGLMSKSMLVTLPIILLLLDFWPLRRLTRTTVRARILEKLPFLALALVVGIVTMHAQRELGAVISSDDLPATKRMANTVLSYAI